ncbi:crotonase/enoyl-CoA hydratase family protein [Pseudonocardia sp. RS11V-5]|uniref:crotonase/enoyl-CoA hydratase family protein n=1 Tax=Pseudonocardia terrae TaxID=2905831 RepID=UPI001E450188|nr:crotonase/enoyl-CoA hydratase family protein [Pseudonocardia terrae]MCE3552878.1 crotonase/enoyl-CoA hydratase family protein [Pseudonocardia terrae]
MGEPTTVAVAVEGGVAHLWLDRPGQANAMNRALWSELREAVDALDRDPAVRVVVLAGKGKHFCAGIDLDMLADFRRVAGPGQDCAGRAAEELRRIILDLQDVITSVERCRKPVVAAVHGACVGAGMDLAVACDLRYATADAKFVIKEIDMGLAADVGVLQRLPRIVGEGVARELAYTGRTVPGGEAEGLRLVNRAFADVETLHAEVDALAVQLAAKPPLALRGTKYAITYARDHSVADGLEQIATWNGGMLLSADLDEALAAFAEKRHGRYRD